LFQLFQPMGGVSARPAETTGCSWVKDKPTQKSTASKDVIVFMAGQFYQRKAAEKRGIHSRAGLKWKREISQPDISVSVN
jgi:hypothetical protein